MARFQKKEVYVKRIYDSLELRKESFEKRWDYHPYVIFSRDFSFFVFGQRRACLFAIRKHLQNFSFDFRLKRYSTVASNFLHGYISESEMETLKKQYLQHYVEL